MRPEKPGGSRKVTILCPFDIPKTSFMGDFSKRIRKLTQSALYCEVFEKHLKCGDCGEYGWTHKPSKMSKDL